MTIDINARSFLGDQFNPDCMELAELQEMRDYLLGNPVAIAREWLPTFSPEGGQNVIVKLGLYCTVKVRAMECRLGGEIQLAHAFERQCEQIYERIPAGVRW